MPKTSLPDDTDKGNAGAPDLDEHTLHKVLGGEPAANDGGALSPAGLSAPRQQQGDSHETPGVSNDE